jgi:FkbM family methyltransferase
MKTNRQARLPNGAPFYYYNKLEMLYLYDEIFTGNDYIHELIDYHDGNVVVDVGANIGLFTYFVSQQCRDARIYSFEPIPDLMEVLKKNVDLIEGHEVRLFNCGLANESTSAEFYFLPHCTARSTMHIKGSPLDMTTEGRAHAKETTLQIFREVPHTALARTLAFLPGWARGVLAQLTMKLHAKSKRVTCSLITLSQFIAENDIEAIDLLKIDAEGCEGDILDGIAERDRARIRQMIVEVHQYHGDVFDHVVSLIDQHGFRYRVERSVLNQLPMIYAAR